MNTILVPTDFSENAFVAARYAAAITHFLEIPRIILYHSYLFIPSATEIPIPEASSEMLRVESIKELSRIKEGLSPMVNHHTRIDTIADDRPLLTAVNEMCKKEQVDLLVAGITGRNRIEKALIGSNALEMARESRIPLMIVPKGITFQKVERIVFACDLRNISETTPVNIIKQVTNIFKSKLSVLHIDTKKSSKLNPDIILEQNALIKLWGEDQPEYYYADNEDIAEGIMKFAHEQQAQLIITVPRKYRFLESLFHRSLSKRLAFKTDIPILLLREKHSK